MKIFNAIKRTLIVCGKWLLYVLYKLRFCTSCNLYKKSVQVATCTNSLYMLQLVRIDLYKLQHVHILDLYKLQLVQAPNVLVEHVF